MHRNSTTVSTKQERIAELAKQSPPPARGPSAGAPGQGDIPYPSRPFREPRAQLPSPAGGRQFLRRWGPLAGPRPRQQVEARLGQREVGGAERRAAPAATGSSAEHVDNRVTNDGERGHVEGDQLLEPRRPQRDAAGKGRPAPV